MTEDDVGDSVTLTFLTDESFFVASHALLLEEHPDFLGTFGTLLGIPQSHVLVAYPIRGTGVLRAIHFMVSAIEAMEREGPDSVSPFLYWYKNGTYTTLPYCIENDSLDFSPPDEFTQILQLLGEP